MALNQRALLPDPPTVREAIQRLSEIGARVRVFQNVRVSSRVRRFTTAAVSYLYRLPYEFRWLWSPEVNAYLGALAATEQFDVVHVDTLGLVPYARHFEGAATVLNHIDVESHLAEGRAKVDPNPLRRLYFRREAAKIVCLEREFCPRVALNLTVSELDATRLREVVPGVTTHVVDNGVDVEYFRPGVSGRPERGGLVFAGLLNLFPNRDAVRYFLADIWPLLSADDPGRHLTIVGRNPPPELVKATRDPRVRAPGWVEDVRPYMDEASIYVCPIRTGGGTRLKVLDALAMGKPLVATAFAVEGLGLVEGRHYLRAEAPAEYVKHIRRLESDPALRRRLAESGRKFVMRRYAWDVIGEKLDQAYRFAVRGSRNTHASTTISVSAAQLSR